MTYQRNFRCAPGERAAHKMQACQGWASPYGTGLSASLKPRLAPGFHPPGSIPDAVLAASFDRFVTRRARGGSAKREEECRPGWS